MCGIAGYISAGQTAVDEAALRAMTRAVAHRGPDDEGYYCSDGGRGKVGFGHRRLSIVDLSADGHQPMVSPTGDLIITFNGEIYNYVELRAELRALGREIRTATDTEVILAAYREWGEACVSHFNGMWAFALYDTKRNRVFCSRDRFGVKPFYYTRSSRGLLFGSEIRQLLPHRPAVAANRSVLKEFLTAGYCEPLEETFFDGVRKLPGGHNLVVDLATDDISVTRYYRIESDPALADVTTEEAAAIYGARFQDAIKLRLRADVAVGTCLSGGLDSSSIATLAAGPYREQRGEAFRGITAASEQQSNDESEFARTVAEHSDMAWITVKPTYKDFAESIAEVVRAQEEPFGGPSVCMQYFVMKTARANGIPVLLDGQGGDETLLGYRRYFAGFLIAQLKRHGLFRMVREIFECWRTGSQLSTFEILTHVTFYSSARLQYWRLRARNRYLREQPPMPKLFELDAHAMTHLHELQKLEIEQSILPSLLRFEDKNSMWHAIETRLPFLDYRAAEAGLSLPDEAKFHKGWTKFLLRVFMDDKMPHDITWRKRKLGFEAPSEIWMRRHADEMRRCVLQSSLLASMCKPGALERDYASLHHSIRWRLYNTALWEREFSVQ